MSSQTEDTACFGSWCLFVRPWHARAKAVHICAACRIAQPQTLADPRQALYSRMHTEAVLYY
jgi:hypothetical protein